MNKDQDDFVMQSGSRRQPGETPSGGKERPYTPGQDSGQTPNQKADVDPKLAQAFDAVDEKISSFQRRQQDEAVAATVFSTAVSAALRREYLDDESNICVQPNHISNFESSPIQWMRLSEVGLQSGFTAAKAAEALENVFSAFHIPDRMRLLFLVSSDSTETGDSLSVHLGLQPLGHFQFGASIPSFISGFSKSIWPGLAFEAEDDVDFDFATKGNSRHRGVRVLTGIPSGRNKENVSATIDKLAEALSGHSWRYLVVAEPISAHEMEDTIRICRDIAGRAESMKSFQLSESIGKTIGENITHTTGESNSVSSRKLSTGQKIALAGTIGVGVLSVVCPALLPAFLTTATTAAAGAALTVNPGLTMLLSFMGGSVLAGASTVTQGESISNAVSKTLSASENFSFSRTVVNKHAEGALKLIESQIERFQLCEGIGAWETGVYFVGENETTAEIGSNILKSLISGDNSHQEPVRTFTPRSNSPESSPLVALKNFDNPYILPMNSGEIITHPFGKRFEGLRTVVNTRELARLINFPLSNVPGVLVKRIAADTGIMPQTASGTETDSILLGKQIYRGNVLDGCPYAFSTASLAKHALVCGINGSGKTNTILGMLTRLLAAKKPFLVIEPAKQEYVDWAIKHNQTVLQKHKGEREKARLDPDWVNVYIPGRERWNGEALESLSINPFDFVWLNPNEPPKTLEHIDRLKTIINAALPMQESLPILMEELIYAVYSVPFSASKPGEKAVCWLPSNSQYRTPEFNERIPVPTFVQMANHLPRLFERLSYAKDVQRNLQAALKTRIDSFKRGWRRPLLNKEMPRHSASDWKRLFGHPTVINLTSLTSDEDKAFFMAVILMFIYEYRQEMAELPETIAQDGGVKASDLKHLLVIEEAHRVLGRCEGAVTAFAAAPKQKVSEMFSNMISEVRGYGQGILIADQIPSRLNEDAVKNTNLKIVHKLVAADDRKAMATALNLWDDQERVIGDLNVGEALVRGDMDGEAYMIKVSKNS